MKMTRREFTAVAAGAAAMQAFSKSGFASAISSSSDPSSLTLTEAAAAVRAGTLTATQLTDAALARIAVFDPKLDAFITVMKEQARAQATQLDAEQKAGKLRGPLHGVPLAIKELIRDLGGARG